MKFLYQNFSIYNRNELIKKLDLKENVSTEILFDAAYRIWGEKLCSEINGDFAFAVYDGKKNKIFAARDPLGIKALYYVVVKGQCYFSDDIDELFELSGIKKEVSIKAMKSMLYQSAVDYEDTMYENIKRIPPGHYCKVIQGRVELHRYWFPEKIFINYSISINDATQKFKELFEKAIVSRIDNVDDTAFELSGGLDSSSIVSVMKKKFPQQAIETYSMYFGALKCDESSYISSVEEMYDFHTTNVNTSDLDYKKRYNFDFNYRMSPHWPVTLTFTMYFPMIEKMKKDGKRVIVTGQGGDHLLTGNCYVVADLLRRSRYRQALREFSHSIFTFGYYLKCTAISQMSTKEKEAIKKVLSVFSISKDTAKTGTITDMFSLKNIKSLSQRADIYALVSASQSTTMDGNVLHAIEKIYDVEFRHPFFDKELVEFVLSLPSEHKYSQGWIKVLLRIAMDGVLPEKVRSRSDKAEFLEVLIQQLEAMDMQQLLKNSYLAELSVFPQRGIDRLIKDFKNGNYKKIVFLWRVVNLEYWYHSIRK